MSQATGHGSHIINQGLYRLEAHERAQERATRERTIGAILDSTSLPTSHSLSINVDYVNAN